MGTYEMLLSYSVIVTGRGLCSWPTVCQRIDGVNSSVLSLKYRYCID